MNDDGSITLAAQQLFVGAVALENDNFLVLWSETVRDSQNSIVGITKQMVVGLDLVGVEDRLAAIVYG